MGYKYPRTSKYNLVVRRSSAGLGLFTQDPIKKEAFIIEYYGPLLTEEAADDKSGKYLFKVSDKVIIEGSSRKNTARYINHSCKPNCEAEIDGKRIFIYAKYNIKQEEELSYHYGKEYIDDFIKNDCKCVYCKRK